MKRPKVTIENSELVYEHYSESAMNPRFARLAFHGFAKIFRSNISWSEGVQETVDEFLTSGGQLVLAANHLSDYDQFVLAALPIQERVLRPLIGTSFIPAKQPLFAKPGLRHAVDALGAIPVFRRKDAEHRGDATDQYLQACTTRLQHGQHMAIFPEGTRNKTEPEKVQKLFGGLGKTVCGSMVENLLILPVGINFADGVRKPRVHLGELVTPPFTEPELVTKQLEANLQASVDATYV